MHGENHRRDSSSFEHFFRRDHGVAVNRDGIFDISRVAAGECDHHGDAASLGDAEDEFIPLLQSLDGQRQAAELVFAIGIGSGDVADKSGVNWRRPELSALSSQAR